MFQPSFKLTPTNLSARSSRDGRTNCWGGQRCGRSRQWDLEDTEEPETEEALQLGGFSYPTSHHPSTSNVNSDRHSGRAAQRRPSPSSSEATPARSSAEPKPEPQSGPPAVRFIQMAFELVGLFDEKTAGIVDRAGRGETRALGYRACKVHFGMLFSTIW